MNSSLHSKNPFGATKAVDLDDNQIQTLWVDVLEFGEELVQFAHPSSAMPSLVLGAKGSGKTHLMRYHSFELQLLRYGDAPTASDIHTGVEKDGYIGVYALCGNINSSRFAGKRQPDEKWRELFSYYMELWLTHHLLLIVEKLRLDPVLERDICSEMLSLFDAPLPRNPETIRDFADCITQLQRELDYAVNNAVMTGQLDVEILVTRGRLIFGLPKILANKCAFLSKVLFVYSIDEFENLNVEQQKVINSLIRGKEIPATIRVGARSYGIKTYHTDGSGEENLRDSEYEVIPLDRIFRNHKTNYAKFAKSLVSKRLGAAYSVSAKTVAGQDEGADWDAIFDSIDDAWNSDYYKNLIKPGADGQRRHITAFRNNLSRVKDDQREKLVSLLSVDEFPLLEKLNLLRFYKRANNGDPLAATAEKIAQECRSFIASPGIKSPYATALQHYKFDLSAQLHRENGEKQYYLGLETFITMSAGLPRALLTILRSIFDWSTFQGEDPLKTGRISIDAQYRGVRDASDWFYQNMRKAGEDGRAIQVAVDRLGQIFRVNRFADRPAEVSLCTFAVSEHHASAEARRILRLAEERSFLNRVSLGGKDKNSGDPLEKFQISPMLAPRWDLPLGRRGTVTLTSGDFNAIFDPSCNDTEFDAVLSEWKKKTSASISDLAKPTNTAQGSLL